VLAEGLALRAGHKAGAVIVLAIQHRLEELAFATTMCGERLGRQANLHRRLIEAPKPLPTAGNNIRAVATVAVEVATTTAPHEQQLLAAIPLVRPSDNRPIVIGRFA
jgi:hypothetical protein